MKILILCIGNSCRSQMAHGFLQSFCPDIEVFSAGIKPTERVNQMAIEVMKEAGIDISGHEPHNVSEYLDASWDYVITVCGGAKENCPAFSGMVKHRRHFGFDDPSTADLLDLQQTMGEFRRVRDEIKARFYSFYLTGLCGKECS